MKPLYFLLALLITARGALGQQTVTDSYTLESAIKYALEHQVSIQNAQLDNEIAQAKVGEIRAMGLPQINGAVSFSDNPHLRRMFFEVSPQNTFASAFAPGAPNGTIISIPNIFQLRTSGDIGLSASQLLFDGSYIVGLQASKTYTELSQKSLTQSKISTVENVTKAYYLVLINKERMNMLDANIARLDSTLKQTQGYNKEGFIEDIDVKRLEVTFNNLSTEKEKFTNLLQVSELLLKFQMGMPVEEPIKLSGDISNINLVDTANISGSPVFENRIEYSLLKTGQRLQFLNLKSQKAAYLPRLVAFGNLGYFGQEVKFTRLFADTKYYAYSTYGLSLTVPIFDGLGRSYKVKQAKLELKKADNNLINMENVIKFQVGQSRVTLTNQLKTLDIQKKNLDLAQEVVRVSKIKYQEGVGSNLELTTAETNYKEAQTNYYNALYDAIVAKIDFDKSTGTLYNE